MMAIFGMLWMGWGLAVGNLFTLSVMLTFYAAFLALLATAILTIRKGMALRKIHPLAPGPEGARIARRFKIISALEAMGIVLVLIVEGALHRPDLLAVWMGLVVGLHFLPLAKLFRFSAYYYTGAAIIACDVLSWTLLRSSVITVFAALGTGIALWATVVYALFGSRQLLREYSMPARRQ
jgi:hypothetical protein